MTRPVEAEPTLEPPARIALVDDDAVFLRALAVNLHAAGYETVCFEDPKQAAVVLTQGCTPDACILDWNMPGLDGLALLGLLREHGILIPVLFLTSHGEPIFEEAALDAGAADFVDKTRGPAIILHRLALALTRRTELDATQSEPDHDDLQVGELTLSRASKRASWRGQAVPLSRNEFDVVSMLAEAANQDVGYRQIYDVVRGNGFFAGQGDDGYRANVRAMVKRIRYKFVQLDPDFAAVRNYPGFGYRWIRND